MAILIYLDPEEVKEHYNNLLGDSVDILVSIMYMYNHLYLFCLLYLTRFCQLNMLTVAVM